MNTRKILVTESDDKTCPAYMKWRKIGAAQHADYSVFYDKGGLMTGVSSCSSLTMARKEARTIVAEGRAWAEVYRWAENGTMLRKVLIASYEVETESGSAIE